MFTKTIVFFLKKMNKKLKFNKNWFLLGSCSFVILFFIFVKNKFKNKTLDLDGCHQKELEHHEVDLFLSKQ